MLTKDNIPFVDIDVNKPENEEEFKKLFEITKCDDVPMVKHNNMLYIPNVSFRSINELFNLIKNVK